MRSNWMKFGLLASIVGVAGCETFPKASVEETIEVVEVAETIESTSEIPELVELESFFRNLGPIDVPAPVDAGGGYSHETHKQNGKDIYYAGLFYHHTKDPAAKVYLRDILMEYADLYPTLGLHPKRKENHPAGQLFWQGLNEGMFLLYAVKGYAQVRDDLTEAERTKIDEGLFNPLADFVSIGSPDTFDRIHNHGTWAVASVGTTGYVLGQPERVDQALYGLDKSGDAGFLKQIDKLFSPDGYYAEGPYYQRFAMLPFVLFAHEVAKNDPEKKIFEYRDGLLVKAIDATVQQSYAGLFFPINDAIREKGLSTVELKFALAIAYDLTEDPIYLGAASLQGGVVPTAEGLKVAKDIRAGKAKPFPFKSMILHDGENGTEGGLVILREVGTPDGATVVFKPTTQGLGHGHFDKLGILYYDNGQEVLADYGAARFLNVEPKFGGHYLPENTSWAKQTIAHNALVLNETSHFDGDWEEAQKYSPNLLDSELGGDFQYASAEIHTAYKNATLKRTVALVEGAEGERDLIIDISQFMSGATQKFDLPMHFKGQLIEHSFALNHHTDMLKPFGEKNGYQHLWDKAVSDPIDGLADFSLLLKDAFYTATFASDRTLEAHLVELGANDPDNNLRHEKAFVLRGEGEGATVVTVLEKHGLYDSTEEVTVFEGGSVASIKIDDNDQETKVEIELKSGKIHTISLSEQNGKVQYVQTPVMEVKR